MHSADILSCCNYWPSFLSCHICWQSDLNISRQWQLTVYNSVIFWCFCALHPRLCKGVKWLIKAVIPVCFFSPLSTFLEPNCTHTASYSYSCGPVLQGSVWYRQSKVHRSPRGATCRRFYANSSHVGRTLSPSAFPGEMADIITAYHGRSENSLLCTAVGRLLTQREPNHKPISIQLFWYFQK